MEHPSGECYEGQWRANRKSGWGTYCYANGAVYKGMRVGVEDRLRVQALGLFEDWCMGSPGTDGIAPTFDFVPCIVTHHVGESGVLSVTSLLARRIRLGVS